MQDKELTECATCKTIAEIGCTVRENADSRLKITKVLRVCPRLMSLDNKGRRRGSVGFRDRPLNFCPECGERIETKQTIWNYQEITGGTGNESNSEH